MVDSAIKHGDLTPFVVVLNVANHLEIGDVSLPVPMGNIWEFDMANLKVLHIFGFELDTSSNEIDLLVHDIGDFQ